MQPSRGLRAPPETTPAFGVARRGGVGGARAGQRERGGANWGAVSAGVHCRQAGSATGAVSPRRARRVGLARAPNFRVTQLIDTSRRRQRLSIWRSAGYPSYLAKDSARSVAEGVFKGVWVWVRAQAGMSGTRGQANSEMWRGWWRHALGRCRETEGHVAMVIMRDSRGVRPRSEIRQRRSLLAPRCPCRRR